MMDEWDASLAPADEVLNNHHFLDRIKTTPAARKQRCSIEIYFDVETTNGAGVSCKMFMLAYKIIFKGYSEEQQEGLLQGIPRRDVRDEGDLENWFAGEVLYPLYERSLALFNESPAARNPMSRASVIRVYAHNGSRFDTLFFLPKLFTFWPTGTMLYGPIADMRYMTAGQGTVWFIDTWRQMGGGSLANLARDMRCEL